MEIRFKRQHPAPKMIGGSFSLLRSSPLPSIKFREAKIRMRMRFSLLMRQITDLTVAHPTIILTTKNFMASYTERMPKEQNLLMLELKQKNSMKEISQSL